MKVFKASDHLQSIDNMIRARMQECKNSGEKEPKLGLVLLGEDFASQKYVLLKQTYCTDMGLDCKVARFSKPDPNIETSMVSFIKERTGVIVQLPLPKWAGKEILHLIPNTKDIDALTPESHFISPVIRAFDYFVHWTCIDLKGKNALILGNGDLIGKPISRYLNSIGANVTISENYKTGQKIVSDIVISGVGSPGLVESKDVSAGCVCVDFGSSLVKDKIVGDMNFGENHVNAQHLKAISPSPGGLGPLVLRYLIMNLLKM